MIVKIMINFIILKNIENYFLMKFFIEKKMTNFMETNSVQF